MSKQSLPKAARDNRANQLNPNHPAYHQSRGASPSQATDAVKTAVGDQASPVEPSSGEAPEATDTSGRPDPSQVTSSGRKHAGKSR
jgi:hypothetical protein